MTDSVLGNMSGYRLRDRHCSSLFVPVRCLLNNVASAVGVTWEWEGQSLLLKQPPTS